MSRDGSAFGRDALPNATSDPGMTDGAGRATRVIIVARTDAVADHVATGMAQDPDVTGKILRGALSDVLLKSPEILRGADILAFEIGSDPEADLHALAAFRLEAAAVPQCIAVTRGQMSEQDQAAFRAAGVQEFLEIADTPDHPTGAEDAEDAEDAESADIINLFAEDDPAEPDSAPARAEPLKLSLSDKLPSTPQNDTRDAPVPADPAHPAAKPATTEPDSSHPEPPASDPLTMPARKPAMEPQTGGAVSLVLRSRGGAGATAIAVDLAMSEGAARAPGQVALADLDLQNGAVAQALSLPNSPQVSAFARRDVVADAAFLEAAMVRHETGIDVLTAPDSFTPLSAIQPQMIAELVDALRAQYTHVVLDMPQTVVGWIDPVLNRCARVLVVTDMSVPSLKRARRLIDAVTAVRGDLPIQVVMNLDRRSVFAPATQEEAAELIGRPLEHWVTVDPGAGKPNLTLGDPPAPDEATPPVAPENARKRSIFSRRPKD